MTKGSPKLGILLPTRGLIMDAEQPDSADLILSMADRVEQAGLDSVWVGDSLTAKPRLEPITTLAAIAGRTSRVRLGTAVLLAAMRNPVLLAHSAGTLDLIARGRTVLAVGAGGAFNDEQKREWTVAGVNPRQRARRLEELVEVAKGLGAGRRVSFEGTHFDLDSVAVKPANVQPGGVPILLACHHSGTEAQHRRAARLGDGIMGISDSPDQYAEVLDRVHTYAAESGRDPAGMESAFYMTINLSKDQAASSQEAERFLMTYYGANIWGNRWGPFGPTEQVIERMKQYADAGADTIIIRFASYNQEEQLEAFLSEVAPHFPQ